MVRKGPLDPSGTAGMVPRSATVASAGDVNQDGAADISDAVTLLRFLFIGSPPRLPCGDGSPADEGNRAVANPNGDGAINLTDAIYILDYFFRGGLPPVQGAECRSVVGCPEACAP